MIKPARLLFAFSAVLCLLRFADLGSAPFVNDEPQFQLLVDAALANHTLPMLALIGSHGVHYGAAALWLYLPIRLFTANISWIIFYHCALIVAGYALLVAAAWKSAGKEVAAWVAALISASPYLFFYSRLPWDGTFLVPLVALLCLCVVRIDDRSDLFSWGILGPTCGLMVDLHLMSLPVLGAALVTLLPILWLRPKPAIRGAILAALAFAVVTVPYLMRIWGELSGGGQQFDSALRYARTEFRFASRNFSWTGMQYFFEGPRDFREMIFGDGFVSRLFHIDPSDILKAAAWFFLPWTGWRLIKDYRSVPILQRMAFFSILLFMIYYSGVHVELGHPHYMFPVWWVMIFFGSLALVRSKGLVHSILTSAGVLTLVMNSVFILAAHAWIAKNHGTRGIHYGPTHVELEDVVRDICKEIAVKHPSQSEAVPVWLDLKGVVGVFPPAVEFDFKHEPECAGHVISLHADQPVPGIERFGLFYRDADVLSAALAWKRIL